MPVSKKVSEEMSRSSWIRRMFEEGQRMMADGKGPVYDFSLGNPTLEPPAEFTGALKDLLASAEQGLHRYMPNVGYASTRKAVAKYVRETCGVEVNEGRVLMTVGAAGGMNVALKSILDPGDEVIVFTPFFPEYEFYIDNHGGVMVKVPTTDRFDIDAAALEKAITGRTKAVLINSPNNPTGVVYHRETLLSLADVLRRKGAELGTVIYLLSDEPYRKIYYGPGRAVSGIEVYENSIVVNSHSKDLGLAGSRIGWVAIHPAAADGDRLFMAMAFCNRTLGFVNAPALMQRGLESSLHVSVDINWYRKKRNRLYDALTSFGYEIVKPEGAFYIFPKAPGGDDRAFCAVMAKLRVLVVPGSGFGAAGYFRISYCVEDEVIEGALPAFEQGARLIRA